MFHFGTEIDPEFEKSVGELTNKLKEKNNYGKTEVQEVASRLMEAEDRRNTYEKWLTTIGDSKTAESIRSLIEVGKRENERGAPQGERQGIRDNQGDGNESSKSDGRGGERIRKQSAVDTQQFFSDTVKGNNKPLKPWEPMYPLSKEQSRVREVWKRFDDGFSEHISTSIPFFREAQFSKIAAISLLKAHIFS